MTTASYAGAAVAILAVAFAVLGALLDAGLVRRLRARRLRAGRRR